VTLWFSSPSAADEITHDYLDLIVTHSIYAKSIWHDAAAPDVGGYWGPVGIAEKNPNGAVRGMTDTMIGYAMLVHAIDNHQLSEDQLARLTKVDLDRATLLKYIRANLAHITAHHKSAPHPLEPTWGFSWQSTMWTGNAGPAVLLVYNNLSADLIESFRRVAFSEADRIVTKPPKNYLPGDTGAEENGWDTYAPAMALALDPTNAHAKDWFTALKRYAVNTYSMRADQTSNELIGTDRAKDIVTTANLFDDFTLENHHIFHPDYIQVSGQELGDSLLFLELGDKMHHTHLADEFRPYALHHVKDVWEKVAKPLILPTGEFAFPNGSDWQLNTSMMPAYFAFITTALHDPIAHLAVERHIQQAMRHRELSAAAGSSRILGDTNMEWFWEPILVRRSVTVLLDFELHPPPDVAPENVIEFNDLTTHRYFPDTNVWLYRNRDYLVSASWGPRHMGTFYPILRPIYGSREREFNPYLTVPIDGILPESAESFESEHVDRKDEPPFVTIKLKDNRRCCLICFPRSVLWLSPEPLRPLAIENDPFSGGKRRLGWHTIDSLKGGPPLDLPPFISIDDSLGLITTGQGFRYTPASKYNRRSYAYEQIAPRATWGAWQMIPGSWDEHTATAAKSFSAALINDQATVKLVDGANGLVYTVHANLGAIGPANVTIARE
jgi:hypothetical protein